MEPGIIKKLDEAVVNRIAAGEIIQRPANALKELIENSLDAKSNYIQITIKSGGLKLLQIQDNGTGIRKEDLEIVCERFTTSKLTKFEDLTNIATYGFRGEALSSISHVAHLTIQTKTAQVACGYKACYEDGKLKAPPKPCAGNQGTIISIEDLFYNMPQRKQALKSPAEEFQKLSDVVSKYAVHNSKIGFILKKFGEQPTIKTNVGSTQEQNIRYIFGANIAKELLPIEIEDNIHKFRLKGCVTKVNYSAKKGIMMLFINHRLVDSAALKSAIDSVYSAYLPKGMHPFIYLSLDLEPTNIDVNVHPTKHEVHFLYEDDIIEKIKTYIEIQLLGSNDTRAFYKQLKLPGVVENNENEDNRGSKSEVDKVQPKEIIRTDAKEQKLDKFLITQQNPTQHIKTEFNTSQSSLSQSMNDESFRVTAANISKEVRLTSVLNMQKRVENNCSVHIRKTLKEMVFVGVVDKHFALFQYETRLYLCHTLKFCEELFYQRLLFKFENLPQIKVEPKLPIKQLIVLALNTEESGWTEEDGDKSELASRAATILVEKAAIMREYFSLNISDKGELETLPCLVENHCPSNIYLPLFLLRLATDVEWETEEECFETFCRETARYYTIVSEVELLSDVNRHNWIVEHIIYPAMKRYLLPPNKLKKEMYELTSLPKLYKVFERC
ncbi:DNA mismatch repair protein Mlh1 [Teleopsis dalmanni]|uniref:DNA mismatch repair protein Mlh1 n=1 Tax=Teleopsis dalmanni TaxID=139649 RepID=UPI0018CDEB3B|nr:DNA mismatch repair protein Mlh1 [Teleopsis dalmanni]